LITNSASIERPRTDSKYKMIKQDPSRVAVNRRTALNAARKQFATKTAEGEYAHRLNFYKDAPKGDITLEQFEQWAIDRLRGNLFFCLQQYRYGANMKSKSFGRTRSMPVPEQKRRRDGSTHEAFTR